MTPPASARLVRALAWTVALCAGLFGLDRWWLGPPRPPGSAWLEVADVSQVPGPPGNVVVPPYLPAELAWPPSRILHQGAPQFSWWLGLRGAQGGPLQLWMGVGSERPPAALGDVAGCVLGDQASCPEGWHALSTQLRDGRLVWVASTLEPEEIERVVGALGRVRPVK